MCTLGYFHNTSDVTNNKIFKGRSHRSAVGEGLQDKSLLRPYNISEAFWSKEKYIRRIAVFTEGVNAKEIPIPTAMKGSYVNDFKVCKVNL